MNKPWQGSSPGFVYFNTQKANPTTPKKGDSSDFLSFGESTTPQKGNFGQQNFNTPKRFDQKSPRYKNNKFQRYSAGYKQHNNPYQNSNVNNNSWKKNEHYKQKNYNNTQQVQSNNITRFIEATCLQDPWAQLEEILRKQKEVESSKNVIIESVESGLESDTSTENETDQEKALSSSSTDEKMSQ